MKVLIVEDEKRIARYIKKGLEQKSIVVDLAHDGEAGFDMASGEKYDVIVLDIMLPKMDGVTVCKNLRKENILTPILLLTAKGLTSDKVDGLESGADDYLVKPFAFSELHARIKALSRRPQQSLSTILSVHDLSLNTTTYEVKRGKKSISLSKKEFALLEFLIRNKGLVLNKDQILEQVWNYESDVLPNTAQVYMGYLRNKIDKPFPKKKALIHTVRGFGYKLDGE